MSFVQEMAAWPKERVRDLVDGASARDVEAALGRETRTPRDLAALLSPAAAPPTPEAAADAEPTIELLWDAPRPAGEMTLDELVLAAQTRHGADGSALTWPPEE